MLRFRQRSLLSRRLLWLLNLSQLSLSQLNLSQLNLWQLNLWLLNQHPPLSRPGLLLWRKNRQLSMRHPQ